MSSNIRRQIAGLVARFLPPGHSSPVKSIGQFSMPIRTSCSSAKATSGRQISRKRGQFSSTDFVQSRPTNVFTVPTPRSCGRADDRLQVIDVDLRLGRVGSERVRVVAEAADLDAVLVEEAAHPVGAALVERRDVDVRDAGVAALGLALRPAHQLDAGEALGGGEGEHLLEREVGQDRGDESELHHFTSGTFDPAALAVALQDRLAQHDLAVAVRNVAKGGGAAKSPFAT